MSIPMPPLPAPLRARIFDGMASVYSPDQLRARDLEVARVVREAAANSIKGRGAGSYEFYEIIRALEVSHAD